MKRLDRIQMPCGVYRQFYVDTLAHRHAHNFIYFMSFGYAESGCCTQIGIYSECGFSRVWIWSSIGRFPTDCVRLNPKYNSTVN